MSDRYPGGLITKTPVTPAGPYAEGSASGVWTLDQAMQYVKQGIWPNANNPTPNDPYFQYVTSLLHGDGTNGGQNNTFLDSSSNAFTITRNGNTTQGSFSPYGSNWGSYYNNAFLASSIATAPGTGAFTTECWVFLASNASYNQRLFDTGNGSTNLGGHALYVQASTNRLIYNCGSSLDNDTGYTFNTFNTWTHVAMVRSGSTVTIYINGNSVYSFSSSANLTSTDYAIAAGATYSEAIRNGYVSNIRTVNSAVYTSNFTPPTSPLTAISNTQMLACQSNRFIDNSGNNRTITVYSGVITRFSPFAPTYATQYSASTIGGSGYFDGSGDYLSLPNNSAFAIGTNDFTFETWAYFTSTPNTQIFCTNDGYGTDSPYGYYYFSYESGAFWSWGGGGGGNTGVSVSYTMPLNQWVHLVAVRSGTSHSIFVNGTRIGNATNQQSYTGGTSPLIGARVNYITGYLSDSRFVNGTAVYNPSSSTLTVPTAPLTAVTNTKLLASYTNGAIYDNAEVADYETVGNAQISTSVKKYGTGSLAFDGTGDYLTAKKPSSEFTFGTGNFTIEMWLYANSFAEYSCVYDSRAENSNGYYPCIFFNNNSGQLVYYVNQNNVITASSNLSTGTWYHLALCRSGTSTKMFINGTQTGSTWTDTSNYLCDANRPIIGALGYNPGYVQFNGYIDDLRVTKGYARYWENFTPPSAALPNFSNPSYVPPQDAQFNYTTLLLPGNGTNGAQNNTFLDSSTNAFTITRNGNTTQGTFTPFSQTGWGNYFSSGNYLTSSNTSISNFGTGAFTYECWVFKTNTDDAFIYDGRTGGNSYSFGMRINGSNKVQPSTNGSALFTSNTAIQLNQWNHIVYCRGGTGSNQAALFINGTRDTLTTDSTTYVQYSNTIGACSYAVGDIPYTGYLSNMRIVKGTDVYGYSNASFTVPTSPLTAITNTTLLTCQSNRFIDNSATAATLSVTGSPSVQAFSPFAPTAAYSASTVGGSGYFDGNGDYLSVADNAAFALGTNNFTVDGWAWIDSNSNQGVIIAQDTGTASTSSFRVEWDGTINGRVYIGGTQYTLTGTSDRRNTWVHFALVRNGSTVYLYVNGVQEATASVSTGSINDSSAVLTIGATSTGGTRPTGYISNVRLVNGTAVYTTAFTPPTAPTTAITNTALLVNFTNAGITDATAKNDLETVGNAQISTTQSKFGGSSIYLDGTDDKIIAAYQPWMNFGTGDFTVEMWINFGTALASLNDNSGIYVYRSSSLESTSCNIRTRQTPGIAVQLGATDTNFSWNPTTGTWYHMAIVRYNGTLTMYVNGNSIGSGSNSGNVAYESGYFLTIGGNPSVSTLNINAYINDLRVTKGYARYVQPFTPPTQADQLY